MCNGITSSGKPCSRKVDWCKQHLNQKPAEAEVIIEIEPITETKNIDTDNIEINIVQTEMPPQQTNIDNVQETQSISTKTKFKRKYQNTFEFKETVAKSSSLLNEYQIDKIYDDIYAASNAGVSVVKNISKEVKASLHGGETVEYQRYFECSEDDYNEAEANGDKMVAAKEYRMIFDNSETYKRFRDAEDEDRTEFDLVMHDKFYDESLFELCCMLPEKWLHDPKNMWQLARTIYETPADPQMLRNTYALILAEHHGDYYDQARILAQYDKDGPSATPKYPTSPLSLTKLKQIIGGSGSLSMNLTQTKYARSQMTLNSDRRKINFLN
jgi:hypothetical protein